MGLQNHDLKAIGIDLSNSWFTADITLQFVQVQGLNKHQQFAFFTTIMN